eukprot:Gb_34063 [translate_table: standard]
MSGRPSKSKAVGLVFAFPVLGSRGKDRRRRNFPARVSDAKRCNVWDRTEFTCAALAYGQRACGSQNRRQSYVPGGGPRQPISMFFPKLVIESSTLLLSAFGSGGGKTRRRSQHLFVILWLVGIARELGTVNFFVLNAAQIRVPECKDLEFVDEVSKENCRGQWYWIENFQVVNPAS